ncbi:hypothetical protein BsWGS_03866 [Bradybaena similaris]
MATNKRKQDEKHLKMLREMVSLPSNKQCFDCHQRGPTYVNMTIGSFVCTSCSGILRGLNPPHRVKSISMASFTPEEMDFLKCHGNELNRKVYLGLYDSRSWPEPDSRDEQRVRDYMVQKYENKRWYVAPTDSMREEAKRANEAALNSKPQVKPLRSLLGENAPKLTVGPSQTQPTSHAPTQVSVPLPGGFKSPPPTTTQMQTPTTTASTKQPSAFDLLSDLGGDPFAPSAPVSSNNGDAGGFADFSNFESISSIPTHPASAVTTTHPTHMQAVPQVFPVSSTPLQPLGRGQAPPTSTVSQPPAQPTCSSGDKYAALADLDSAFSAPVTTATSINWGGLDGGIINWGGTSSTAGTPSQSATGMSWSGTSTASVNWNSPGAVGMPVFTTAATAGFGAHSTAANPFGVVPGVGLPAFSGAAPTSTVNPFQTSIVAGMPTSTSAGFGGQFAVPGQPGTGFGQFAAMQNGGFGMASSSVGYGGSGAFTQQQFMMSAQPPGGVQQAGGWGHMGAVPVSQSVVNPFMNTAMHQVPPPSGSTNPFL